MYPHRTTHARQAGAYHHRRAPAAPPAAHDGPAKFYPVAPYQFWLDSPGPRRDHRGELLCYSSQVSTCYAVRDPISATFQPAGWEEARAHLAEGRLWAALSSSDSRFDVLHRGPQGQPQPECRDPGFWSISGAALRRGGEWVRVVDVGGFAFEVRGGGAARGYCWGQVHIGTGDVLDIFTKIHRQISQRRNDTTSCCSAGAYRFPLTGRLHPKGLFMRERATPYVPPRAGGAAAAAAVHTSRMPEDLLLRRVAWLEPAGAWVEWRVRELDWTTMPEHGGGGAPRFTCSSYDQDPSYGHRFPFYGSSNNRPGGTGEAPRPGGGGGGRRQGGGGCYDGARYQASERSGWQQQQQQEQQQRRGGYFHAENYDDDEEEQANAERRRQQPARRRFGEHPRVVDITDEPDDDDDDDGELFDGGSDEDNDNFDPDQYWDRIGRLLNVVPTATGPYRPPSVEPRVGSGYEGQQLDTSDGPGWRGGFDAQQPPPPEMGQDGLFHDALFEDGAGRPGSPTGWGESPVDFAVEEEEEEQLSSLLCEGRMQVAVGGGPPFASGRLLYHEEPVVIEEEDDYLNEEAYGQSRRPALPPVRGYLEYHPEPRSGVSASAAPDDDDSGGGAYYGFSGWEEEDESEGGGGGTRRYHYPLRPKTYRPRGMPDDDLVGVYGDGFHVDPKQGSCCDPRRMYDLN